MKATMQKFISQLVRKAGAVVRAGFGKTHQVRSKGAATNVVSEIDLAAEKIILQALHQRFPGHGLVAEENGCRNEKAEYVWYVDPLDGTLNFVQGVPIFCVMIGLARRGKLISAVIYDPMLERLYSAQAGRGAYLNGERIFCSRKLEFKNSTGCVSPNMLNKKKLRLMGRLIQKAERTPFGIYALGSAGIAGGYVAAGSHAWWISLEGGPWDYAAPALILQEAGCQLNNIHGRPWQVGDTSMVAANKLLQPTILRLVRESFQL